MFSVGDVYGKAFQDFSRHWVPLVLAALVFWVLFAVIQGVEQFGSIAVAMGLASIGAPSFLMLFVSLALWIVNLVVQAFFNLGWAALTLKATREDDEPQLGDLFSAGELVIQGVIAQLLFLIAAFVSVLPALAVLIVAAAVVKSQELMLLAIPVALLPLALVFLLTMFKDYFIVDRHLDAISALRASFDATKGNLLGLVLFAIASFLVMLGGAFLCGLPMLFVSFPIVMVGVARAYEALAPAAEADAGYEDYEGYGKV